MSHPVTNREWVALLCFFARQSHQSCFIPWPTASEWCCFISLSGSFSCLILWQTGSEQWHYYISLLGSLMNYVSSHDQQLVSYCDHCFSKQSHESCLIPWPTVCEWHCFISLPDSLINHFSYHDKQEVSDTALFINHGSFNYDQQQVSHTASFLCQAVS